MSEAPKIAWPTEYAVLPLAEMKRAQIAALTDGVAVYAALCALRRKSPKGERSAFYASYANISERCSIPIRTIHNVVKLLEKAGVIKCQRPTGKDRINHQAIRYTLIPIFEADNTNPGTRSRRRSGAAQLAGPDIPPDAGPDGNEGMSNGAYKKEFPLTGGNSSAADGGALSAPACVVEFENETEDPDKW